MDMSRTPKYIDDLLKELSVKIASNDLHNNIRDVAKDALMRCWRYQGGLNPSMYERLCDFAYEHLKRHIPTEYLEYGESELKRRAEIQQERMAEAQFKHCVFTNPK
jgi:hypothetical protein